MFLDAYPLNRTVAYLYRLMKMLTRTNPRLALVTHNMVQKAKTIDELLRENFGRYQARDFIIIKKLQKSARLTEPDLVNILSGWESKTECKQALIDYLVSHEILIYDIVETIKEKGLSQIDNFDKFLNPKGVFSVRTIVIRRNKKPALKEVRLKPKNDGGEKAAKSHVVPRKIRNLAKQDLPNVGMHLGKCLLTEFIGKGSSCIVYKGFHETLNIPVAIKLFLPHHNLEVDVIRSRFVTEAQALAKLNHPYIVRVLDFEPGPPPFMVLEYVSGRSLEDLISDLGHIPHQRASYYVYRAAVGLIVAHRSGIIHRDIKPANILITKNDEAKLTDLGMAYIISSVTSEKAGIPMTSKIVHGTPAYIAPEQALNPAQGDVRSDVYSLGATFFHAITGRFPFTANSVNDMIMKHLNERLVPPHNIISEIPLDISKCIQKMMAKKPEDRFQTVEDLLPDLMTFFLDSGYYPVDQEGEAGDRKKGVVPGPLTKIIIDTAKKVVVSSNARKQAQKGASTNNAASD